MDDDDDDNVPDNQDAEINGDTDRDHDMADLVLKLDTNWDPAQVEVRLETDGAAGSIRIFTQDGGLLIGPETPNSFCNLAIGDFTDGRLNCVVEGVEPDDTVRIGLVCRDPGSGITLVSDWVAVTVSDTLETEPLSFTHSTQHKDTQMLCGGGCEVDNGGHNWDNDHGSYLATCPHCASYCMRASTQMFNRYYKGKLSQDRISYHEFECPGAIKNQLGHGMPADPMGLRETLPWSLGLAKTDFESVAAADWQFVANAIICYRPVYVSWRPAGLPEGSRHASVVCGVRIQGGVKQVRLCDPARMAPIWVPFADVVNISKLYAVQNEKVASIDALKDEPGLTEHSDNDRIVDFDEDRVWTMEFLFSLDKTKTMTPGLPWVGPDVNNDKDWVRAYCSVPQ